MEAGRSGEEHGAGSGGSDRREIAMEMLEFSVVDGGGKVGEGKVQWK
jgi:hypothetical protein